MNRNLNFLKSFVLAIFVVTSSIAMADVPQKFNYQGVIRDIDGAVEANKTLIMRMSIRSTTATGSIVWQEQHTKTTNEFGLVTVVVGTGVNTGLGSAPSFADIDWAADLHFLEVEVDFGGGMNSMGTTQLLSVPYALVADRVLNSGIDTLGLSDLIDVNTSGATNGSILMWNGSMWVVAGDITVGAINATNITSSGAVNAQSVEADTVQSDVVNTAVMNANFGEINLFSSTTANIENLNANIASIDTSLSNYAEASTAVINNAQINTLTSDSISTTYLYSDNIENDFMTTNSIMANLATIDFADVVTAEIDNLVVTNLTATNFNEMDGDTTNELISAVILLPNDSLLISEGANMHYVDLGSLNNVEVDGDVSNELIDSVYLFGSTLNINENGTVHTADISSLLIDNTIASAALVGSDLILFPNNGQPSITINLSSISNLGDNDQDSTNELISGVSFMNDTLFISEAGMNYAVSLASLGLPDSIYAMLGDFDHLSADSLFAGYAEVNTLEVGSVDAVFITTDNLEAPVAQFNTIITQNAMIDTISNASLIQASTVEAAAINSLGINTLSLTSSSVTAGDVSTNNILTDTLFTTFLDAQNSVIDTITTIKFTSNAVTTQALTTTGNVIVGDAPADVLTVNATTTIANTVNLNGSSINVGNASGDLLDVDATSNFNAEVSFQDYVYHFGDVDNFGLTNFYAKSYHADSIVSDGAVKINNSLVVADTMLNVDVNSGEVSIKALSTTIGSGGSPIAKIIKTTVTVDVPNINPGNFSNVNVTITGANLGSVVSVSPENDLGNLIVSGARVSSVDNVTIKIYNPSGGAVNPAAMEFYFLIVE